MIKRVENNSNARQVQRVKYTPNGLPLDSSDKKLYRDCARYIDNYYTKEMNKLPFGFGPLVATTETVAATSLVWYFKSPATWINLFTTLGEWVQTWVAGTDCFDKKEVKELKARFKNETLSEDDKEKIQDEIDNKSKATKENREGAMAWVQVLAGVFGLVGFVAEKFSGKDDEPNDVPVYKKVILSGASALNVFLMFFGAGEKTLMSTLSANSEVEGIRGREYKSMEINGHSDWRCFIEWAVMSIVPWVSNISLGKNAVDLGIIYGALKEGFEYFLGANKVTWFLDDLDQSPKLKKFFNFFTNPIGVNKKEENDLICFPFNRLTKWFLGNEGDEYGAGTGGFRNNRFVPILKFFGCKPPNVYMSNDGNITCEIPSSKIDVSQDDQSKVVSVAENEASKVAVAAA